MQKSIKKQNNFNEQSKCSCNKINALNETQNKFTKSHGVLYCSVIYGLEYNLALTLPEQP